LHRKKLHRFSTAAGRRLAPTTPRIISIWPCSRQACPNVFTFYLATAVQGHIDAGVPPPRLSSVLRSTSAAGAAARRRTTVSTSRAQIPPRRARGRGVFDFTDLQNLQNTYDDEISMIRHKITFIKSRGLGDAMF